MVANITPPPGSGSKLKEYKFYSRYGILKSDESNPTLYYMAQNRDGTVAQSAVSPGSYVGYSTSSLSSSFSGITCFAGENESAPVLFIWSSGGFWSIVGNTNSRKEFAGVGEDMSLTLLTPDYNGESFSFYLPQS